MSRSFGQFANRVNYLADSTLQTCHAQTALKAFHGWRRHTATFLSDLAAPNDVGTHIDDILAITETGLKIFLPGPWPAILRERFQEIIATAIRLDCDLSQQWAYWYVDYPDLPDGHGSQPLQKFDNTLMKVPKSHEPDQTVFLMISPALYKAGDSRGQGYEEQDEVARKCEVVCGFEVIGDEDLHPHRPSQEWHSY